eukprot:Clim_evm111s109 gene=Clim_evmTU111s109
MTTPQGGKASLTVMCGNSHPELAQKIVETFGIKLTEVRCGKFANQETRVEIRSSVRETDTFVLQSGCGEVNDVLMELLILVNACRTASAARVVAVMPYYPYSKQSKKKYTRGNIPAKLVANMLRVAGVDQLITMDLHAVQIQGFFDIPVDNLVPVPLQVQYIQRRIMLANDMSPQDLVIVAKNSGGAKRVTHVADKLGLEFAIIHQSETPTQKAKKIRRRLTSTADNNLAAQAVEQSKKWNPNQAMPMTGDMSESDDEDGPEGTMVVIGNVSGRSCIMLDDLIDEGKSFLRGAEVLKDAGATEVYVMATHGIFSGDALKKLEKSTVKKIIVTNTIPQEEACRMSSKLEVIDVAPVFAEAIRRIHHNESVSYLYENVPV